MINIEIKETRYFQEVDKNKIKCSLEKDLGKKYKL